MPQEADLKRVIIEYIESNNKNKNKSFIFFSKKVNSKQIKLNFIFCSMNLLLFLVPLNSFIIFLY